MPPEPDDDDIGTVEALAALHADPWALLNEWMTWWKHDDRAPSKLPGALHVRTAVALVQHGTTTV